MHVVDPQKLKTPNGQSSTLDFLNPKYYPSMYIIQAPAPITELVSIHAGSTHASPNAAAVAVDEHIVDVADDNHGVSGKLPEDCQHQSGTAHGRVHHHRRQSPTPAVESINRPRPALNSY